VESDLGDWRRLDTAVAEIEAWLPVADRKLDTLVLGAIIAARRITVEGARARLAALTAQVSALRAIDVPDGDLRRRLEGRRGYPVPVPGIVWPTGFEPVNESGHVFANACG
jgi:hypothetical protein